ncbi:hypothetical protein JCM33374_g4115 [Metschnikowia sp. JCM 33374]|nr:hypothetical protein JCM33374_g4115 [Metschnikowia sp. JCM 33374]
MIDTFKPYKSNRWTQNLKYHKEITSSHNLIAVKYFQGTNSDVQLGKPRFQFPLRRLHPPFNRARTWNIPSDASIEEAINSIQSDGQEYIELVGYLRKNDPQYLQYLLADGQDQSLGGPHYKAARMFFQSKKSEKVVFKTLTNNVLNKEANTTPSMVKLATDYYKELYSSPPLANWNELRRYLKPLKTRTTRRQRDELGKPFTQSELEYALESMDKSTAPGPDGIQYSVLQYYWANIGPSLTRAANDMMDTGDLPPGFQKVLITLIPKNSVAKSKDIKDQRPISLSNTCLKVISKAVCIRLQKIMDVLIGPYQRGFIKGRRINQNTMEFFTMLERLKENRSTEADRKAILMIDFTKAFDRISHQYMRQVLFKIGLGSQLVRLIMSILTDQEAQIMLNDWEGERFPLRCGTRQGNPLSPLLFNLALEPFLLSLQSLSGIPIEYEGVLIESMKYHAFADDVNIYLGEDEDYQKAAQAINAFERVSNSRVSETKTKLF